MTSVRVDGSAGGQRHERTFSMSLNTLSPSDEVSSKSQAPAVLAPAAAAAAPAGVDATGQGAAVRTELVVLSPSPDREGHDHGRAE